MSVVKLRQGKKEIVISFEGCQPIRPLAEQYFSSFSLACGGQGRCGKCLVRTEGAFLPPDAQELNVLCSQQAEQGWRLACKAVAAGDAVVWIPLQSEISLAKNLCPKIDSLSSFAGQEGCGAAIDIGTTTLAAEIFSLKTGEKLISGGAANAQAAFGADVISRMAYSRLHGPESLRDAIRRQITDLCRDLCEKAGATLSALRGAVITGNTVMLHLLAGLDPSGIAVAPFTPSSLFGTFYTARGLGLFGDSDLPVYLPRCVGPYVGADIICAAMAAGLYNNRISYLLLDIGTNGEMMLSTKNKLLCCSTAAGPAFEGAGISQGMPAREGAIDHVYPDFSYSVIGAGKAAGICGSGLLDAVAAFLENGMLDETGRIVSGDSLAIAESGVILTQQDIRTLQLAKAAIAAGMDTLLEEASLSAQEVKTIGLAGGFGSFFLPQSAAKIGLLPSEAVSRTAALGNAALAGASMLLLNEEYLQKSELLAARAREITLSSNDFFKERYIEQMMFGTEEEE